MKSSQNHFFSRLLLIAAAVVISGTAFVGAGLRAQNAIGFSSKGLMGMPDSIWSGSHRNIGAFVKNFSPFPYGDSIQVSGYIDTGTVTPAHFTLPPFYCQLTGGDSTFILMPFDFSDSHMSGRFRIGNNTIVIWPAMHNPNWGTFDSLTATVVVMDSINSTGPQHMNTTNVRCFPVPVSGPLYIEGTSVASHPVSAVVRNMQGQIVAKSDDPTHGIDTSLWAAGIYMIEVTSDDGQVGIYKVVRK